jgi:hypothetical protein
LKVTGSIPTTTGNQVVVPTGATGVLLNVTAVSPTANGFLSIRPADAPGAPTTSSLNVVSGEILPNGVAVSLPTAGADAGKIEITFDAYGTAGPTTDVLIDVVGYTINSGLQDLEARLVALRTAPIVMSHGPGSATVNAIAPTSALAQSSAGIVFAANGFVNISLNGPIVANGAEPYSLQQVEYCVRSLGATATVNSVIIAGYSGTDASFTTDSTIRAAAGCYVVTPSQAVRAQNSFSLLVSGAGGTNVTLGSITSTWAPRSVLGVTATATDSSSSDEVPELAGT